MMFGLSQSTGARRSVFPKGSYGQRSFSASVGIFKRKIRLARRKRR